MHILVEGTIMEQRYEQSYTHMDYSSNPAVNPQVNFQVPVIKYVPVKYKIIVDSKDLMLFITDKSEYFADIRGKTLQLTEAIYKDLLATLVKLNNDEAILLNESKKKVEGKELKDIWTKQNVNGLLGLEVP